MSPTNNHCPVMYDLNAHLRDLDEREARAEAVIQRAAELIDGEFAPLLADNLGETLGNLKYPVVEKLSALLRDHDMTAAGRLIHEASIEYWVAAATQRAEQEMRKESR